MKKILIVTGGAGFVGSNLIKYLLAKTSFKIISIDNYSSGSKRNHIKNNRVKYIKSNTKYISNVLNNYKRKIHTIFHFGEFARIFQSFKKFDQCFDSNSIGSKEVFNFTFNEIFLFGIILNITAGIGAFLMGFLDDKLGGKKNNSI